MPGTIILVLEIQYFKWDIKFKGAEEKKQTQKDVLRTGKKEDY